MPLNYNVPEEDRLSKIKRLLEEKYIKSAGEYENAESAVVPDNRMQGAMLDAGGKLLAALNNRSQKGQIGYNRIQDLGREPTVRDAAKMEYEGNPFSSAAEKQHTESKTNAKARLEEIKADMLRGLQMKQDADKVATDQKRWDVEMEHKNKTLGETVRHNQVTESNAATDNRLKQAALDADKASKANEKNSQNAFNLFKDYDDNPTSKATAITGTAYKSIVKALSNPSPANDMAGIFAYMRLLDSTSTVREGEYATAENARGVPETTRNLYNKIIDGTILTPAQRLDFMKAAELRYTTQLESQAEVNQRYRDFGNRYDFPTEGVIPEDQKLNSSIKNPKSVEAELRKRGLLK